MSNYILAALTINYTNSPHNADYAILNLTSTLVKVIEKYITNLRDIKHFGLNVDCVKCNEKPTALVITENSDGDSVDFTDVMNVISQPDIDLSIDYYISKEKYTIENMYIDVSGCMWIVGKFTETNITFNSEPIKISNLILS